MVQLLLSYVTPLPDYSPGTVEIQAVFQILFYVLHSGAQSTPLHMGLAQALNEMTRSKLLIQNTNRLGVSVGYDELERHNVALASRILSNSEGIGVPRISSSIA